MSVFDHCKVIVNCSNFLNKYDQLVLKRKTQYGMNRVHNSTKVMMQLMHIKTIQLTMSAKLRTMNPLNIQNKHIITE